MKFHIDTWLNLLLLLLATLIFWGCPDSASTLDPDSPVGELQFTYLQNDQILYFAIDVASSYRKSSLDTATTKLIWFGTNKTNTPDNFKLNDEGKSGDILKDDDLYSLKIINDSLALSNPIENDEDTGKVYLEFQATYHNGSTFMVEDSFYLGNIIPRICCIDAPATISLPDSLGVTFKTVTAKVIDANGPNDIRRVGFVSYHLLNDSTRILLNDGNIINLYDDGSEVIIYEPNITSGDAKANDDIYSFRIPVFGPGNPDDALQTKTGIFDWIFEAMDMANAYSDTVIHRVCTGMCFESASLADDTSYVDVTFNAGAYNTNADSGALETSDFSLTFSQNGGPAIAAAISSVKKDDFTSEDSASVLSGGETVIRMFLGIPETLGGVETILIKPADGNSIYNSVGTAMSAVAGISTTLNDLNGP